MRQLVVMVGCLAAFSPVARAETCIEALETVCKDPKFTAYPNCVAPFAPHAPPTANDELNACRILTGSFGLPLVNNQAIAKTATADSKAKSTAKPGDVQPQNRTYAGAAGTPNQVGAAPSVQPNTQTGVDAGLAGTAGGPRLVPTLSFNPATVFAGSNDADAKTVALTSRLFDLSVALPVRLSGATANLANAFDYVAVRLRANLLAPVSSKVMYDKTVAAFKQTLAVGSVVYKDILDLITNTTTKYDCIVALENIDKADVIAKACAGSLPNLQAVQDAEGSLRDTLRQARSEADRYYLGIDARFSYGDPTFSGKADATSTDLVAALAGGIQFGDPTKRFYGGLQARVGGTYSSLPNGPVSSVDFAAAVSFSYNQAIKVVEANVGIEGREGKTTALTSVADTNFIDFKAGLSIPLSDGTKAGVAVSVPLQGSHGTIVSITGNWASLLQQSQSAQTQASK